MVSVVQTSMNVTCKRTTAPMRLHAQTQTQASSVHAKMDSVAMVLDVQVQSRHFFKDQFDGSNVLKFIGNHLPQTRKIITSTHKSFTMQKVGQHVKPCYVGSSS